MIVPTLIFLLAPAGCVLSTRPTSFANERCAPADHRWTQQVASCRHRWRKAHQAFHGRTTARKRSLLLCSSPPHVALDSGGRVTSTCTFENHLLSYAPPCASQPYSPGQYSLSETKAPLSDMHTWTSPPSSGALTDLLRSSLPQRGDVFVKRELEIVSSRPSIADLPPLLPPRAPFLPGISDVLRTANNNEEPATYQSQQQQEFKHEVSVTNILFRGMATPQHETSRCVHPDNHPPVVSTYSAVFMSNSPDCKPSTLVLPSLSTPSSYASTPSNLTPPGLSRARTRPIGLDMPIRTSTISGPRPASRTCKFAGCTHYVVDHGLCVRHGGGKRCTTEGCTSRAKHFGRCWRHGGSVECKASGCPNRAKSRGYCWSHGGGTKCKTDKCEKIAISNGLCWAHGGGKRCIVGGCKKQAYERTDNYCNSHFQQFRDSQAA